ncbi:hypothetical protein [Halalkalibacter krulwichiae]|uniref:Uncharacterized protein n=1 Tax=Halalkalibacter krulwichiae TaxID=199441 RepID=A0A1X9MAG1_9BACI|nr:hypothetical protein [Halalkalibacter krulwichiae]ARK29580.1 hypothetical protein BkAM31D_06730 [Halalkalibacter krulwichiae]
MDYLMFCDYCGMPKPIEEHIMREYFWIASHVYCSHCEIANVIPDELQSLALEMRDDRYGSKD